MVENMRSRRGGRHCSMLCKAHSCPHVIRIVLSDQFAQVTISRESSHIGAESQHSAGDACDNLIARQGPLPHTISVIDILMLVQHDVL
jgi:hypothetical protein